MAHELRHVQEQRPPQRDDRSLGDLFGDLSKETTTLVRKEVELAKVELSHKATSIGKDVGFLAAGGAVAYAGLLAIIASVILGLIQIGVTWWLSALIVGVLVLGVGGFLVIQGINDLKKQSLAPTETIETLKEDGQWAKEQTS